MIVHQNLWGEPSEVPEALPQAESKYVVFKREDWEAVCQIAREGFTDWEDLVLPDAEVIRCQDITSAPIFHTYASILHSYLEIPGLVMSDSQRASLLAIADHFHSVAVMSETWPVKKLPD